MRRGDRRYERQRYEKLVVLVYDEPDKITFSQKAIQWFYHFPAKVDALTDLKSDHRGQVLIFKSPYIEKNPRNIGFISDHFRNYNEYSLYI